MPYNQINGDPTTNLLNTLFNQISGSGQGIAAGGCCQQQPQEAKISKDFFNGKTIIEAGSGNDNIRVSNGNNGGLNVNVNGQNYYFTAQEAQKLVIRGGDGNDNIRVDSNVRQNLTIEGGNGNDNITGGSGNDRIFGGAGNDRINGGNGNDSIWGGSGNDRINGGNGNDTIHGGSGNDTLNGGNGNDNLIGGTGADSLNGGRGFDRMNWGNAGLFDMLTQDRAGDRRGCEYEVGGHTQPPFQVGGGQGFEPGMMYPGGSATFDESAGGGIFGGNQPWNQFQPNDSIQNQPWNQFQPNNGENAPLQMPPHNCWLPPFANQPQATVTEQQNGKLVLDAGAGDDKIRVSQGYNGGINVNVNGENHYFTAEDAKRLEIRGGSGNDQITVDANVRTGLTLKGGAGDDTIIGGSGNDRIFGGSGNDILLGRGGNDYINGGSGNDLISGGNGNDTLVGGNGNDVMFGGRGNDNMFGGNGNDIMVGGSGHDNMNGGNGNDMMFGGRGNDRMNGGSGIDYANGGSGSNQGINNENFMFRLMQARLRQ
jgi:Ca2+-binding RTX toxin-like protein